MCAPTHRSGGQPTSDSGGVDPATSPAADAAAKRQSTLIAALCRPGRLGSAAEAARCLQTHISYVLLTGAHAYKIKKAIRLGFLDFSTLAARRHYCEQELRLNRRLAPDLYLDVVTITGIPEQPEIGGSGPVLEYAVRMREFPQDALLRRVLERNALLPEHVDQLAALVARFHREASAVSARSDFGRPENVLELALANFAEMRQLPSETAGRARLDALEMWTRSEYAARSSDIAARRIGGFVRECHGDLHLGNIALVDGVVTIFDCIEFNERMRWIDVMSEIAFTVMDLERLGRRDLAYRFLDAYLAESGDYAGVALLPFYIVYRAMVRAKVASLRSAQASPGTELERECDDHLRLAEAYASASWPAVVITHGVAGCGKTTLSQALLEGLGAIRIRSDVERKRLHGLEALTRTGSGLESGLYTPDAAQATYRRLLALARAVISSGMVALVDAAFLQRWQRELFRELAADAGVPFVIVDIGADPSVLRRRVLHRSGLANDASEAGIAVLEHQLKSQEVLSTDERSDVVSFDGNLAFEDPRHRAACLELVERLRGIAARDGACDISA